MSPEKPSSFAIGKIFNVDHGQIYHDQIYRKRKRWEKDIFANLACQVIDSTMFKVTVTFFSKDGGDVSQYAENLRNILGLIDSSTFANT